MEMRKPMTSTEIRLFKEKVIRDYKLKHQSKQKNNAFSDFAQILRRITPINIGIGIVASIIFIFLNGWNSYFQQILIATIWITIISTILSAVTRKKR
jgi:ABC-type multidrug transport system permease subunit